MNVTVHVQAPHVAFSGMGHARIVNNLFIYYVQSLTQLRKRIGKAHIVNMDSFLQACRHLCTGLPQSHNVLRSGTDKTIGEIQSLGEMISHKYVHPLLHAAILDST